MLDRLGMTVSKETKARCSSTAGIPRQLDGDSGGFANLESRGWALLLIYSNSLAASRSARPVVAEAMALLEGRCEFFEASDSSSPELATRYVAQAAVTPDFQAVK